MGEDDQTLVTCPRCGGAGARTALQELGDGRYAAKGEVRCWLCEGLGSVTIDRARAFREAK